MISKKDFIKEVKKGYKNNEEIKKQFTLDYPRTKIFINNSLINQENTDINTITNQIWEWVNHDTDLYYNFLSCCTQSTMAYPLEKIHSYLPGYLITDSKTPLVIMINSEDLSFLIYKKLNLTPKNQQTPQVTTQHKIQIKFNIKPTNKKLVEITYKKI